MSSIRLKNYYIFLALAGAYLALIAFYPFLWFDSIKFLLFQAVFLLLPGCFFSRTLISGKLSNIENAIFGYPVSVVLLFILSWVGKGLNIAFCEYIMLVFSAFGFYSFFKKRNSFSLEKEPDYFGITCALFYIVSILIVFMLLILPSALPSPGVSGLYYPDGLWVIGNTWSYIRGFPLEDARFAGVPFGYHMLENIFQATVYKFTKIDPFAIYFYLEPLFDWFIMVFIIFYAGLRIAGYSLRKIFIFCALLFFTNSFLLDSFQAGLFYNPGSMFFGISAFILFSYFIIAYFNKRFELKVVYLSVLFLYFTATKAILGLIVPLVLGVILVFRFFKKRFSLKEISLLFCLAIGVCLLKCTMLRVISHKVSEHYNPSLSRVYLFIKNFSFFGIFADKVYAVYRFFSEFVRLVPIYLLNYSPLVFLGLFLFSIRFRKKTVSWSYGEAIFGLFFFAVSIILVSFLEYGQSYYVWYPQILFIFLGAGASDYILSSKGNKGKIIIFVLFAFAFLAQIKVFANWQASGLGALAGPKRHIWDQRASISFEEYEAMKWLRANTLPDAVFFTDRRYFRHEGAGANAVEVPRFYGYTALSGRRAFAEGEGAFETIENKDKPVVVSRWEAVNRFLSSRDAAEQAELLRKINAGYFIQSLRFNDKDFSYIDKLKLIFENNGVRIFRIIR